MPPKEDWIDERGDIADATIFRDPAQLRKMEKHPKIDPIPAATVAIDGILYELDDFHHPGGASINLFGGNDVTVLYKMIHPLHSKGYHTKKMTKVGVLQNYKTEYAFGSEFEQELKREVFKIVPRNQEFGTPGFFVRAIVCLALYFYLQWLWLSQGSSYGLAMIYGISCAWIGLNVQHDANHGAASKTPWINELLGFGADLIGGNKWIWMEKHWTHHAYTNHTNKDPDGIAAEPIVLFNNYPDGHRSRRWHHKLQAALCVPAFSLYWLATMINLDIVELVDANASIAGMNFDNDFVARRRKLKLAILSRFVHVCIHIVAPFLQHGLHWATLGHVMTFGAAGSLSLGLLFVLSHNFVGADRDPTEDARRTGGQVCWYKSQVETSSSYGGFLAGALTGGLNFQVEHHLFPRMNSAWYPYIAPTVRKVCKKHGVNYTYFPWVWQNMISTLRYVHSTGRGPSGKTKTP